MKAPRSRHPYDTLQTALRSAFPIDARRLTVFTALMLAVIQARTVVLYTLKNHVVLEGQPRARYQRLLRFMQFSLPETLFARFTLSFLPAGDLELILNRTNWKLGCQDINILLLSAVWNGFSLPLMWTLLPHGGASDQRTREALVERFLTACPQRQVRCLLADREFIGKHWFAFLDQQWYCAVYSPSGTRHHWTTWLAGLGRIQEVECRRSAGLAMPDPDLRCIAARGSDQKCCWRDALPRLSRTYRIEPAPLRAAMAN